MKKYSAKGRVSPQLRSAIDNCLHYHDRYKGSYHWNRCNSAKGRRGEEKQFANNNPPFEIEIKEGTITVEPSLSISCKNFYYSLKIQLNGEKKNVTLLKKLIK